MRARLKNWPRRPSPAMVVAFVALLVALGGTAYAATTIVNIADPNTPANVAKVDNSGALKTAGTSTVSGFVGQTAPKTPFYGQTFVSPFGVNQLIGASKATVALTRFEMDNPFDQTGSAQARLVLSQRAGNATACNGDFRPIGTYTADAGETVAANMESPIVLKPLVNNTVWCLMASLTIQGNPSSVTLPTAAYSGYVVSGALGSLPGPVAAGSAAVKGEAPRLGR
jgi:hypothetical protein